MIGFEQIVAAMQSMMPRVAAGMDMDDYKRELHVDPEGLRAAGTEAAEEEFLDLPAMGAMSMGRLRSAGLSARQQAVVLEALVDTYEIAFVTALEAERWRRAQ